MVWVFGQAVANEVFRFFRYGRPMGTTEIKLARQDGFCYFNIIITIEGHLKVGAQKHVCYHPYRPHVACICVCLPAQNFRCHAVNSADGLRHELAITIFHAEAEIDQLDL